MYTGEYQLGWGFLGFVDVHSNKIWQKNNAWLLDNYKPSPSPQRAATGSEILRSYLVEKPRPFAQSPIFLSKAPNFQIGGIPLREGWLDPNAVVQILELPNQKPAKISLDNTGYRFEYFDWMKQIPQVRQIP